MDLRLIDSFIAVAESKSFVRAAASLHMSQPAISAHIQRLERSLDVRLFERTKRTVTLTQAGEAFLTGARSTVAQAQSAVLAAQRAGKARLRTLRVGCPPSVLTEIMPQVVTEFHRLHPDVKLDLKSSHTSIIVSGLQDESIDVGYVRLPIAVKGLRVTLIHQEPLVVCLPEDHLLAKSSTLSVEQLRGEKFILYGRKWAAGFHDRIVRMCRKGGVELRVSREIDEMYLAPSLVAAGDGIAIVPRMVVNAPTRNVVVRKLSDAGAAEPLLFSQLGVAIRVADASQLARALLAVSRSVGRHYSMQ